MKTLTVDLGTRSYPIHIGAGLIKQTDIIKPYILGKTTVSVSNTTVAPLYLKQAHQLITKKIIQILFYPMENNIKIYRYLNKSIQKCWKRTVTEKRLY